MEWQNSLRVPAGNLFSPADASLRSCMVFLPLIFADLFVGNGLWSSRTLRVNLRVFFFIPLIFADFFVAEVRGNNIFICAHLREMFPALMLRFAQSGFFLSLIFAEYFDGGDKREIPTFSALICGKHFLSLIPFIFAL